MSFGAVVDIISLFCPFTLVVCAVTLLQLGISVSAEREMYAKLIY
jgi:hypothetical protein